jgi:hypothetical protein
MRTVAVVTAPRIVHTGVVQALLSGRTTGSILALHRPADGVDADFQRFAVLFLMARHHVYASMMVAVLRLRAVTVRFALYLSANIKKAGLVRIAVRVVFAKSYLLGGFASVYEKDARQYRKTAQVPCSHLIPLRFL